MSTWLDILVNDKRSNVFGLLFATRHSTLIFQTILAVIILCHMQTQKVSRYTHYMWKALSQHIDGLLLLLIALNPSSDLHFSNQRNQIILTSRKKRQKNKLNSVNPSSESYSHIENWFCVGFASSSCTFSSLFSLIHILVPQ